MAHADLKLSEDILEAPAANPGGSAQLSWGQVGQLGKVPALGHLRREKLKVLSMEDRLPKGWHFKSVINKMLTSCFEVAGRCWSRV